MLKKKIYIYIYEIKLILETEIKMQIFCLLWILKKEKCGERKQQFVPNPSSKSDFHNCIQLDWFSVIILSVNWDEECFLVLWKSLKNV